MFEELKKKLDGLAQEVALLKEQQALQTGECSTAARRNTLTRGQAAVREKAVSSQCHARGLLSRASSGEAT